MLWTDKGTAFYNKRVAGILQKYNITLYSRENVEKASAVNVGKNNENKHVEILFSK